MAKGGGGSVPGPTAEETQQKALQNQLLQKQLAQISAAEQEAAYKRSPEYLNQQMLERRGVQQQEYNTGKTQAYNTAKQNIIKQFQDLGMPEAAAPYLAKLDADYNALQYRAGNPYGSQTTQTAEAVDGTIDPNNFDRARYLAGNPDVAQSVAEGGWYGDAYNHYLETGQKEGRTYGSKPAQYSTSVINGTADSWDDPNKLLASDYGVSDYINSTRTTRKNTDFDNQRNAGWERINSLGLDDGTRGSITDMFGKEMQNLYESAGLSANDYSKTFDANAVLDSVLNNTLTNKRNSYTTAARGAFAGLDPNMDFADTADDQYITDIVGRQYSDAQAALDRAKARGSLTDTGYGAGLNYLGEQRKTADSTAQGLGNAVLTRYRGDLSGIKDTALSKAGQFNFGDVYDPSTYTSQYTTKKDQYGNSLEGDINSALAGQNWFDVGSVLTKAGYAQGAQNVAPLESGFSTPAGLAALANKKDKNEEQRGLGGGSTF